MANCSETCQVLRQVESQRDGADKSLDAADALAMAAETYLLEHLQAGGYIGPRWLEQARALDAYWGTQEESIAPELRAFLDETALLEAEEVAASQ